MHLHYSFTWNLHLGKSVHKALYNYRQCIMFIVYALQLCHLINSIFLQEKISMELCILMNALNYIYIYVHTHTYTCICCCLVTKLCLTLLQLHGLNSPSGSSVHGIFQARILEWVAISFSKGSSQPRDQTHVSCMHLLHWQADSLPLHHLESPGLH